MWAELEPMHDQSDCIQGSVVSYRYETKGSVQNMDCGLRFGPTFGLVSCPDPPSGGCGFSLSPHPPEGGSGHETTFGRSR